MSDIVRVPESSLTSMSEGALEVIRHLCESDCRGFGSVLQWCETRGDCTYAVTCPECSTQFVIDEDELGAIERWTDAHGHNLVCGLRESA